MNAKLELSILLAVYHKSLYSRVLSINIIHLWGHFKAMPTSAPLLTRKILSEKNYCKARRNSLLLQKIYKLTGDPETIRAVWEIRKLVSHQKNGEKKRYFATNYVIVFRTFILAFPSRILDDFLKQIHIKMLLFSIWTAPAKVIFTYFMNDCTPVISS